ncbi:MAG TPA: ester cyclase [Vicinamibacterales bacterium]|jgi:steroid delta-isomerase-like uncharacterized protein|nr:ester cyclase [Vicinamibacterales bacterium]
MGENETLARRWFRDVWQPGGEATVLELLAGECTGVMEDRIVHGRQDFLDARTLLFGAFPDIAIEVEDVVEQGDKVAVRWRGQATHTGDALGFAATNKTVSFRGMSWLEFEDGKIVRGWDAWNLGALLQSLAPPAALS